MAVVIKMMSAEDLSDANCSKGFKLYILDPTHTYEFERLIDQSSFLVIKDQSGETVIDEQVTGNCYVMDSGKTIATFAAGKFVDNN